jgi:hypothetical protein
MSKEMPMEKKRLPAKDAKVWSCDKCYRIGCSKDPNDSLKKHQKNHCSQLSYGKDESVFSPNNLVNHYLEQFKIHKDIEMLRKDIMDHIVNRGNSFEAQVWEIFKERKEQHFILKGLSFKKPFVEDSDAKEDLKEDLKDYEELRCFYFENLIDLDIVEYVEDKDFETGTMIKMKKGTKAVDFVYIGKSKICYIQTSTSDFKKHEEGTPKIVKGETLQNLRKIYNKNSVNEHYIYITTSFHQLKKKSSKVNEIENQNVKFYYINAVDFFTSFSTQFSDLFEDEFYWKNITLFGREIDHLVQSNVEFHKNFEVYYQ